MFKHREQKLSAFILKKQSYNEGDEILTVFSDELGKLRVLAKSIKRPAARLQQRLQSLFLCDLVLSGGQLPKVTGVKVLESFARIREDLGLTRAAWYAAEAILKATPDGQKNPRLFALLGKFYKFLESAKTAEEVGLGLVKFKIELLDDLGVTVSAPELDQKKILYFTPEFGGFSYNQVGQPSSLASLELYRVLQKSDFLDLAILSPSSAETELQALLSQLLTYQLERKLYSENLWI